MSLEEPGLRADEKVCPFCAETIKRAAVKCRYCGSDLPGAGDPVTAAGEPSSTNDAEVLAPAAALDEGPEDPPRDRRGAPSILAGFRTTAALLVLCLVLAAVTGVVWFRTRPGSASGNGPITSVSARDAGLQAATTLTQKVFSYTWTTFDRDATSSEAVMTPTFRREYATTLAKARTRAIANQVKQVAKVSSSSVVTASTRKVEALVFMNILTTGKTGTRNLTTSRLVVTLTRDRGEWRISDLEPI